MSILNYSISGQLIGQMNLFNGNQYGFAQQITSGTQPELKWRSGQYPLAGAGGGSLRAMLKSSNGEFWAYYLKTFSDDRLKHNEVNIKGLETIRQLNPQKYIKTLEPIRDVSGNILEDYVNQDISGVEEAGFIAQELLNTDISYCVSQMTGEEFNPYSVDYNSIFTYAIQAIKELDVKMNNLEAENSLLLSRVAELENS